MWRSRIALAVGCLLLAARCEPPHQEGGRKRITTPDAPALPDAADAGSDAGEADAGPPDAGPPDPEPFDAGSAADAGPPSYPVEVFPACSDPAPQVVVRWDDGTSCPQPSWDLGAPSLRTRVHDSWSFWCRAAGQSLHGDLLFGCFEVMGPSEDFLTDIDPQGRSHDLGLGDWTVSLASGSAKRVADGGTELMLSANAFAPVGVEGSEAVLDPRGGALMLERSNPPLTRRYDERGQPVAPARAWTETQNLWTVAVDVNGNALGLWWNADRSLLFGQWIDASDAPLGGKVALWFPDAGAPDFTLTRLIGGGFVIDRAAILEPGQVAAMVPGWLAARPEPFAIVGGGELYAFAAPANGPAGQVATLVSEHGERWGSVEVVDAGTVPRGWRVELVEGGTLRDTTVYCDLHPPTRDLAQQWTWWPVLLR